ncbi:MAG: RNA polymerase sigma factor [Sandaracinaceae bacterium]
MSQDDDARMRGHQALRLVQGGRREADPPRTVEEAFQRYARYVGAVAYRLLGRDEDVDDVVQEVFVDLVRGWDGIDDRGAVRGWLRRVTIRAVSRRLKRRRLRRWIGREGEEGYADVASPGASPEQAALLGQLYRELDALPVDDRLAWTLRHVEGERLANVAELTGCSLATAKRRIARAHGTLSAALLDPTEGHDG